MCVCWDGRRVDVSVAMTTGVVTSLIHGNISPNLIVKYNLVVFAIRSH